jgi:hypothetical protein
MTTMPITDQATKQEWHKILILAQNNGFPKHVIQELRKKLRAKVDQTVQKQTPQQQNNRWVTFTYHGLSVREIIKLYRRPNLKIAFCPTNTIYQQLSQKPKNNDPSGIYQLKCNKAYVGQRGRVKSIRHKEHLHYIKNNNPTSAHALHILHNKHEFGPAEETLKLLKPCNKGTKMNC